MLTFDTPIEVGTLASRVTVSRLEIASISINMQRTHVAKGVAVMSLLLEDPDSGQQQLVTYNDASVLEFLGGVKNELAGLLAPVWAKMMADKRLPSGTIDVKIPQETAIDTAVQTKLSKVENEIALTVPALPSVNVVQN